MIAHLRGIRLSPKKANILAGLIRRKKAVEALDTLKIIPQKPAKALYKVLLSAVSNAENNFSKNRNNLSVESVIVNKGPVMRRFLASTRGRALPLRKPMTHISIQLSETL